MSFWPINYHGDIHPNEGQLGQAKDITIVSNVTMTPPTDFIKLFHRYYITNNSGGTLSVTLPAITATTFTLYQVIPGWSCIIKNCGTDDIEIETTAGNILFTIKADRCITVIAEESDGSLVTDWEVIDHNGEPGPTGPTGPAGPDGAQGTTGATGASELNEWVVVGDPFPHLAIPTITDSVYTFNGTVMGATANIGTENLYVEGSMVVNGNTSMPTTGVVLFGTMIAAKGFRYGNATGNQFDPSIVGTRSVSFGVNNTVRGDESFAVGTSNSIPITSVRSVAIGSSHTINTSECYAFGAQHFIGTGDNYNFFFGRQNTSTGGGLNCISGDTNQIGSSDNCFIHGISNNISASINSGNIIFGNSNSCSGASSNTQNVLFSFSSDMSRGSTFNTIIGNDHSIDFSTAINDTGLCGRRQVASSNNMFTYAGTGTVRAEANPAYALMGGTTLTSTGTAIIGRITATGAVQPVGEIITNTFTTGNADIGEYFEKVSEYANVDLTGYFVKVASDGKITKATTENDVIGIVSGTSMATGDAAELHWAGAIEKDTMGRPVTEYCKKRDIANIFNTYYSDNDIKSSFNDIEYSDTAVDAFIDTLPDDQRKTDLINALNDTTRDRAVCTITSGLYDPEQTYIPRSKRPEWQVVGILGKIYVYDDGSCIVGDKCTVNSDGVATAGTKWYVMERIDTNIIRILFK